MLPLADLLLIEVYGHRHRVKDDDIQREKDDRVVTMVWLAPAEAKTSATTPGGAHYEVTASYD